MLRITTRMELQTVLTTLVRRVPTLRLAGEVEWRTTALVRGPGRLPVDWWNRVARATRHAHADAP